MLLGGQEDQTDHQNAEQSYFSDSKDDMIVSDWIFLETSVLLGFSHILYTHPSLGFTEKVNDQSASW